ncbi:hypothetical protein [Salininema proteolyticum]|uniref:Uncharacterized protein n=1 Tax=Salininema proteolyticum TaxID=1607685 RepID=A0ABV8TVX9_9ACTN
MDRASTSAKSPAAIAIAVIATLAIAGLALLFLRGTGEEDAGSMPQPPDAPDASPDPEDRDPDSDDLSDYTPPPNFYTADTCERLELTAVVQYFGTSAKGDRGLQPAGDAQSGYTLDTPDDRGLMAELKCGYYGPGSTYIDVTVTGWADDEAAAAHAERTRDTWETYEDPALSDRESDGKTGFLGHLDTTTELLLADGPVTYSAYLDGRKSNARDEAENAAATALQEIERRYDEVAQTD